jgi:AcrR family transcriptional regulator
MILAGKELVTESGISALKVRKIAARAGVNLGMFNYHFGTREKYIERLVSEVYEEFFSNFKMESETSGNSLERLRKVLLGAAFFIRENRTLIEPFIEEIMKGNKKLFDFARKNMTKHVNVILALLAECQKDGYIVKTPILAMLPMIIGAVALPNIVVRILEKNYKNVFFGLAVPGIRKVALSDSMIAERVDLVLRGLRK